MIPPGHKNIAGIATHHNVLNLWVEGETIQRQMCLDHAPVALGFKLAQYLVKWLHPIIQPERYIWGVRNLLTEEN
jgi:hypothetical protein